ncbi:MAG: hypothetical protein RSB97_05105, partial [Christensenella sp.]
MTKVTIDPGVCGFITSVEAHSDDQMNVAVTVKSGCESVRAMMQTLGDSFDAYDICLKKPGVGAFFEYASENFPVHAACPIISGIIKCMEVECRLALKKDSS